MPNSNINIRRATPDDAADVARVHVQSWQEAYKGLMPQSFLDGMDVGGRTTRWRTHMETPGTFPMNVAEVDGKIIGIAAAGKSREVEFGHEATIYLIYILEEAKGLGIGRRLMRALKQDLEDEGFTRAMLWVLDTNPSRKFYEHLGGKEMGEKQVELGGETLTEVAYGWDDFSTF